jgi:small subunit ribosomal protein S11
MIMADDIKTTEDIVENPAIESEAAEVAAEDVSSEAGSKKKKKKIKRQILKGQAHIKCTYNNTMVMLSDQAGAMLAWSSSGLLGFKGAKKATPYAASQVVQDVAEKVKKYDLRELEVFVRGVGSGRESSIRALANKGFELTSIKDVTPIPHNGCRPKKPRRV